MSGFAAVLVSTPLGAPRYNVGGHSSFLAAPQAIRQYKEHDVSSRLLYSTVLTGVAVFSAAVGPSARCCQAQVTRGFNRTADATATYNEANRQRDLWMMEVQMKPVRLAWVRTVDKDGNVRLENIWYMAYRAINRPLSVDVTNPADPINTYDPLPGPPQFVPAFDLVVYDDPDTEIPSQIVRDEVLPQAMDEIREVEGTAFKDSVSVVQDLPEPTPADAEDQQWIYGIAMWRNVDPETDYFKVILRGFSNGYEESADGGQISRKVVIQKFKRPGDRFDPNLKEFAYDGLPVWTYQPDGPKPSAGQTAAR